MKRGLFITFEGGEGAGKTVQMGRLVSSLRASGHDVIETGEPGGTPEADKLWDFFIANKGQNWSVESQLFFMFTLRTLHVENVIIPALKQGKIVVCARFTDSTRVYQGYAGGLDLQSIETVKKIAINGVEPDLTFYLDIEPAIGLGRSERRANGRDTFEEKQIAFHEKLRQGYLAIAEKDKARCVVVDANRDIETIAKEIFNKVQEKLT